MTSFHSFLELLYCIRVKAVAGRNLVRVTDISLIADGSFSGWDLLNAYVLAMHDPEARTFTRVIKLSSFILGGKIVSSFILG
jgi:hypothetical protein